ncbi:MAG TPA: MFS transporter [Xanthobacteraceae bacterium]|nr:MFS transporter [Xanthobacteraceae bacterium]
MTVSPEHQGIAVPTQHKFHYGWVVVGVTFLTLLIGAGVRSAPGVLLVPLETEFHWSRATISFAIAVSLLLYGLAGPFSASFMERFGIRRTMLAALSLLAVGVALTTLMRESWQLVLLWGVVVGAGAGVIANVLGAVVAARWFTARRGLVVGLLTGSAAAGQLIFLPTFAAITEHYGWRAMSLTVTAVALVVIPIVAILMRERPEDVGLAPYGETGGPKPVAAAPSGNPFGLAIRTLGEATHARDFWLLAGSFFCCGASTNGLIGTHLIPACLDNGIPEVASAGLLAGMGIFNVVGTTASGWLSDRVDNRVLLAIYYSLRGLSLLFLPFSFVSFYGLSLFAIFYGLDWIATVPPTVRLSVNAFGKQKAGIVFGWIFASHQLGSAAAAYFAGLMRADLGSYLEAFILSGVLCFAAALMVMFIGVDWRKREPAVSAA